jgi:hypothetical protein
MTVLVVLMTGEVVSGLFIVDVVVVVNDHNGIGDGSGDGILVVVAGEG